MKKFIALIDGDILMYRICYTLTIDADMRVLKNYVNAYIRSLLDKVECSHYIGILGIHGSNNTKYTIFPDYKRGRPFQKPPHWNEVMNYLISGWGFTCISGCETDDALRYCQEHNSIDEDSIIVSSDKDLLQVPGKHFVMGVLRKGKMVREDKKTEININEGELRFYRQMLTGDMVDNVRGIDGIGPKTAEKLIPHNTDPVAARITVLNEYSRVYGEDWQNTFIKNEVLLRVNGAYAEVVGFERPEPVFYKDLTDY